MESSHCCRLNVSLWVEFGDDSRKAGPEADVSVFTDSRIRLLFFWGLGSIFYVRQTLWRRKRWTGIEAYYKITELLFQYFKCLLINNGLEFWISRTAALYYRSRVAQRMYCSIRDVGHFISRNFGNSLTLYPIVSQAFIVQGEVMTQSDRLFFAQGSVLTEPVNGARFLLLKSPWLLMSSSTLCLYNQFIRRNKSEVSCLNTRETNGAFWIVVLSLWL